MLGHLVLFALGLSYLAYFGTHWLDVQPRPLVVRTRPVHPENWCQLSLGTFYVCASVVGV